MIAAKDGLLQHLRRYLKIKSKRCWLVSALLCISCGKKVTDQNRGKSKVKTKTTHLTIQEERIPLNHITDTNLHEGSRYFQQRAFYTLPSQVIVSSPANEVATYFQVKGDRYEFVCYYGQDIDQGNPKLELEFQECRDEKGILLSFLAPNEQIYIPENKEMVIEAKGIQDPEASFIASFDFR